MEGLGEVCSALPFQGTLGGRSLPWVMTLHERPPLIRSREARRLSGRDCGAARTCLMQKAKV